METIREGVNTSRIHSTTLNSFTFMHRRGGEGEEGGAGKTEVEK